MKVEEFDRYDYPINAKQLIEKMQERVWEQGRPPRNRTNEWVSAFTEALNIVTNEPKSELTDCLLEDADDMISRAELFNKLATVNAPMEANAYKAEVYRIINEM